MARRLLGTLWGWGAFALACGIWGFAVIPVAALVGRIRSGVRPRLARATSALLGAYVRSLPFLRLEVERGAPPEPGPRILVANHQSYLDPVVLLALEPGIRGPARGYLFRVPALATILRTLGFFPADSGGALPEPLRVSAADPALPLLFFPEGTRSRSGAVAPFHRGAFRLAFDHDLPIQPVVIEGLDRVLPPGAVLIRSRGRERVRVRYLDPLFPPYGEGIRRDVVRALTERARRAVAEELSRMREERAVEPPPRVEPARRLEGERRVVGS